MKTCGFCEGKNNGVCTECEGMGVINETHTMESLQARVEKVARRHESEGAGKASAWDLTYYAACELFPEGDDCDHRLLADYVTNNLMG